MSWDQIKGDWKQFKGKIKEKWGKLTDDDIDVIAGKRDQLIGKIQEQAAQQIQPAAAAAPEAAKGGKG